MPKRICGLCNLRGKKYMLNRLSRNQNRMLNCFAIVVFTISEVQKFMCRGKR